MREAEKYEIKPMYVVVQFGEIQSWSYSEEAALSSAAECVDQQIADHWRHKLPVQVTPEMARDLDIRMYRLDAQSQVELPFQKWFDQYYQERQESARDEEEREYKRFLELRKKYEDRFLQEQSSNQGSLRNCL